MSGQQTAKLSINTTKGAHQSIHAQMFHGGCSQSMIHYSLMNVHGSDLEPQPVMYFFWHIRGCSIRAEQCIEQLRGLATEQPIRSSFHPAHACHEQKPLPAHVVSHRFFFARVSIPDFHSLLINTDMQRKLATLLGNSTHARL